MPSCDLLPETFPHLQAGRFLLREILASDAANWHGYASDPRVMQFTSAPPMAVSDVEQLIAAFAEGFRRKRQIRWAIAGPGGRMVGDCGYNLFWDRDSRAEIGYLLDPGYWRRGVMTVALSAVIEYGFTQLGLNKIEAHVSPDNEPSGGLLRKLGFQLEGRLREYRNRRGVFGDSDHFGLLKREWTTPQTLTLST